MAIFTGSLLLLAVDFMSGPSYEVVVAGKPEAEDTKKMVNALRTRFLPNKVVILRPDGWVCGLAADVEHARALDLSPFVTG